MSHHLTVAGLLWATALCMAEIRRSPLMMGGCRVVAAAKVCRAKSVSWLACEARVMQGTRARGINYSRIYLHSYSCS